MKSVLLITLTVNATYFDNCEFHEKIAARHCLKCKKSSWNSDEAVCSTDGNYQVVNHEEIIQNNRQPIITIIIMSAGKLLSHSCVYVSFYQQQV